ncbi:MAG TPA: endonuclease III [Verrucomicrobia subdivision 6 bacterium]|uniref:Endonuclease III n=1 Tax=Verrucomicrobia subdivision 6 bacterium BACL9 MAG-120507-bin52 TaxID=1655590 RepID=A0A0R2RPA5_9BACT|nr:MAG: endonuclease III [Verrucomicrobia subdivision 6 bacterium BACL9 MAG-120507-bin52]HBZ84625.1 endonuclease III [Verrucomicrobia subdivision 6 bacterium]
MTPSPALRRRTTQILAILKRTYPDAHCALNFTTPLQLLIATILSAQCTDERVNQVTPGLFARCPDAASLAAISQKELEKIIHSTGFYRAKARSLRSCAASLVAEHGGKVPKTMEALHQLAGVGRKTANVVLGNAFGLAEGVVVDTHVGRLSRRMGLTRHLDPVKVESALVRLIPKEDWTLVSHLLIAHGRKRCMARNPNCPQCELRKLCPQRGV